MIRGGAGADTFIFDTAPGAGNIDKILDFEVGVDQIVLDQSVFVGLAAGALSSAQVFGAADGLATDAQHRIVYDTTTGVLHFDPDGNGAEVSIQFATLTAGLAIDDTSFFVM